MTNASTFFLVILLLSVVYATFNLLRLAYLKKELVYSLYGISGAVIVIIILGDLIKGLVVDLNISLENFNIWGSVIAIAFILCGLMELIRDSKPEFARFPKAFIALPVLIIISFPFITETIVLKYWLLGIYEATAIIVAIMMHVVLSKKDSSHLTILAGIVLLAFSYLFYWLPVEFFNSHALLWQIVMIIGLVVTIQGYSKMEYTVREEYLKTSI